MYESPNIGMTHVHISYKSFYYVILININKYTVLCKRGTFPMYKYRQKNKQNISLYAEEALVLDM